MSSNILTVMSPVIGYTREAMNVYMAAFELQKKGQRLFL